MAFWKIKFGKLEEKKKDHTFKYWSPVVGSYFGRTCLILARIWLGVPRHWLFHSASGGHPPRLYPIRGLG